MAQIRFVACVIILALSLNAGAADTNSTGTVDASQNMSWGNFKANDCCFWRTPPWFCIQHCCWECCPRWDSYHFHHASCSPILAMKKVRENACFANRATCKTVLWAGPLWLKRSACIVYIGRHCFNQAFMPVSLQPKKQFGAWWSLIVRVEWDKVWLAN